MDNQNKSKILEIMAHEAAGFYKLVTTMAGGFLGASLIFMEKIVPNPTVFSIIFLGIGWLLLIVSIVAVGWVRRLNLRSAYLTLGGESPDAKKIEKRAEKYSTISIVLLGLGIFFIMFFGFINIVNKFNQ